MICTASAELPDLGADVMVKAQKTLGWAGKTLGWAGKTLGKSHGKMVKSHGKMVKIHGCTMRVLDPERMGICQSKWAMASAFAVSIC